MSTASMPMRRLDLRAHLLRPGLGAMDADAQRVRGFMPWRSNSSAIASM